MFPDVFEKSPDWAFIKRIACGYFTCGHEKSFRYLEDRFVEWFLDLVDCVCCINNQPNDFAF